MVLAILLESKLTRPLAHQRQSSSSGKFSLHQRLGSWAQLGNHQFEIRVSFLMESVLQVDRVPL
jgi:hypothetical protein